MPLSDLTARSIQSGELLYAVLSVSTQPDHRIGDELRTL